MANFVKEIAQRHNYNPTIEHLEPRHEVKHAYCDHEKAKKLLNFQDKTDLIKVIEKMFLWAMNEPKREIKYREYEISKNIYSYWKS